MEYQPKAELERKEPDYTNRPNPIKSILLEGPVFGKEQLDAVTEARNQINKWRTT